MCTSKLFCFFIPVVAQVKSKCDTLGTFACHRCTRLNIPCDHNGKILPLALPLGPRDQIVSVLSPSPSSLKRKAVGHWSGVAINELAEPIACSNVNWHTDGGGVFPIDLLRESFMTSFVTRDINLLRATTELASLSRYSLVDLMHDVPMLGVILSEVTLMLQAASAGGGGHLLPLVPMTVLPLAAISVDGPLPAGLLWVTTEREDRGDVAISNSMTAEHPWEIIVKRICNGRPSFFTNDAFDFHVATREQLRSLRDIGDVQNCFFHPKSLTAVHQSIRWIWQELAQAEGTPQLEGPPGTHVRFARKEVVIKLHQIEKVFLTGP